MQTYVMETLWLLESQINPLEIGIIINTSQAYLIICNTLLTINH